MYYSTKLGKDYAFEIEIFKTMWNHDGYLSILSWDAWISSKGDHSPQIHFHFILFGFKFIDVGIHNIHHEECEEDCNASTNQKSI